MPSLFSVLSGWLMTHLVALGFLGFLLVAILAKGPLFGLENWPGQVPASSRVAPPVQQAQPGLGAAGDRVHTEEPAPDESPAATVAEPPEAENPEAGEAPVAPPLADRDMRQPVFRPTQPDVADHQQFVPISGVNGPENAGLIADLQEKADILPNPHNSRKALGQLEQARAAFWGGELERAEKLYLDYLSLEPTDAATFGELGNLYQSMGRPGDALDAYYEAGIRFKSQGDQERLGQIVELLSETGDPRAAQLGN
jgi:hypothetical protein